MHRHACSSQLPDLDGESMASCFSSTTAEGTNGSIIPPPTVPPLATFSSIPSFLIGRHLPEVRLVEGVRGANDLVIGARTEVADRIVST